MKKIIFILFVFTCFSLSTNGQELSRSATFGALIANLNDSIIKEHELTSDKGVLIQKVFEGTSAHKGGLTSNDILISFAGEKTENISSFLKSLRKYSANDKVAIQFYRNGQLIDKKIVLLPKPKESSDYYDIIYSSVHSGNNHLRTIITKPKGNDIYPAVFLIGGVGCYSVDNPPSNSLVSFKHWVDSLTMNGFVTYRVEKTGMGDSRGIPCNECDFITEKRGYADGLDQLRSLPYVDSKNIFLTGFSMGGVIAPILAQKVNVKGIIVYGTAGKNWFEYELANTYRQKMLEEFPADSLDLWMRAEYKRLYGLFVEHKTPEQIMEEHPETATVFFNYPMRVEYFQQVADIDIGKLWMNNNTLTLIMHGASDFVSSAEEHELIAGIVNRNHPGKAVYKEIENSDHWELYTESELISMSHSSKTFNPLTLETAVDWLLNQL